jgi:hypothetical protein
MSKSETHGSQHWLLNIIDNGVLKALLEKSIGATVVDGTGRPVSKCAPAEKSLESYVSEYHLITESKQEYFDKWWIMHRGKRPTWDYICKAKIDGKDGLIIVEAKAHKSECGKKKKVLSEDANVYQKENHDHIENAIEKEIKSLGGQYSGYYQIANRIAYANHIREYGVPTVLVFLGFIGDDCFDDPWKTEDEWKADITRHIGELSLTSLIDTPISDAAKKPCIKILHFDLNINK